ncbi:MAG: acyl carrier protein [Rhodopirellula sp.]|mgnify:CR=1 FL=1|nr:acyl carrier protein [Rhodopirellula sp.]
MTPLESIRGFVQDNFLFGEEITFSDDASLLEQGLIDSTGVLELVAFLEEQFGIAVEDEELAPENLDSIDNLMLFIERKTPACTSGAPA